MGREEKAQYMKKWREDHKEEIIAYRIANKERDRAYNKKWAETNTEKVKAIAKRHRDTHKDEISEKRKRYYSTHKEEAILYRFEYYKNNRDKCLSYAKDWREHANKEEVSAKMKIYRAKNKEKLKEDFRSWHSANPEKRRSYENQRRAQKRNAPVVEKFLVSEIYERDGWVCQLCKEKVSAKLKHPHPMSKSIDRIIPLSQGGSHCRSNVHLTHLRCNVSVGVGGTKQTRLF
jgi:hypothetical protein